MDLENPRKKISFNQDTSCSNNVSISKGMLAFLIKLEGSIAFIICGEIEVTCPAASFTILD
ncbi:MAG: hypothetical protein HOD85_05710 [Deltaproteobacteria bacterium]|jgi:hypothetical protein|nr:hypothetical protein [Deltaproteobacteria bacterium]MBT4639419.1 hypothetical protein [Deltaproteobacteria bacterium]